MLSHLDAQWKGGADWFKLRRMFRFACPYCWEVVEPPIEPDLYGEMVWDCEVCCRPWLIRVRVDYDGQQQVDVERAQD